jgi:hypothetical protein
MGSLWGLLRDGDTSAFVGGRQRRDEQQAASYLEMGDEGHFHVASNFALNLPLACNTKQRAQAWDLLPDPPLTFGYRDAESMVKPAPRSGSSFNKCLQDCKRLGIIVATPDDKLMKSGAAAARRVERNVSGDVGGHRRGNRVNKEQHQLTYRVTGQVTTEATESPEPPRPRLGCRFGTKCFALGSDSIASTASAPGVGQADTQGRTRIFEASTAKLVSKSKSTWISRGGAASWSSASQR